MLRIRNNLLGVAILALSMGSFAGPVTFFGEDPNANLTVPAAGASIAAKAAFQSQLPDGSQAGEDFEGFALGQSAPLAIFGSAGTLTSPSALSGGQIENRVTVQGMTPGRFNTTPGGGNWWQSSSDFTLAFNQAISGFGFYGTDFSDFGGGLSLELLSGNDVLSTLVVRQPGGSLGANGSLLFFGFLDTTQAYTGIRFVVQQTGTSQDVLGFDDFIAVSTPVRTVPEPSTLMLGAVALALAARKSRK